MKKIFTVLLCCALATTLTACGSKASNEQNVEAQQVEGKTDPESVARARQVMEALFAAPTEANMTEIDTIKTTTEQDGLPYSHAVITTKLKDTTGETPKFYIQTVTQPANENTDATYYIHGKQGVIEVQDEKAGIEVSDEYLQQILKPTDSSVFRAYYDCADKISYYKDTNEVVQLTVNPEKLMATKILSDFVSIESCVAEYTFTPDGKISIFLNTVKGVVKSTDGQDVQVTIETKCLFTDYGVTQVPELPEITDESQEGQQ